MINVNLMKSTLYESRAEEPSPEPEPALAPSVAIPRPAQQLAPRYDLPALPPAQDLNEDDS